MTHVGPLCRLEDAPGEECGRVDALLGTAAGEIFFFRGPHYYRLAEAGAAAERRSLAEDWGLPAKIDTAFTWRDTVEKTYVFKGNQYWKFTFHPVRNKPEKVSGK